MVALVEVPQRAGAGPPRIAAGSATTCGHVRTRRAFRGYRENTQLGSEFSALTRGAFRLVAAKHQGFKLVLTLLADILKNRHADSSRAANPSY